MTPVFNRSFLMQKSIRTKPFRV